MRSSKFNNDIEVVRARTYKEVLEERHDEEDYETPTLSEQQAVEADVLNFYKFNELTEPVLSRQKHVALLKKSLTTLSKYYESLDSSRPWLCYWILHSLQILGERLCEDEYSNIIEFLDKCQLPDGGFGGGPGQRAHLASTYAAVSALCIIGTQEAYDVINRKGLHRFLMSMRGENGEFSMHHDGEVDIRGVYCAISVAKLTNVYSPEMFKGTDTWVAKCQTWEGGFGGCPGMEAHGGYSYCGFASLFLLRKTNLCRLTALLRWIVNKQMRLEGGFEGRTNKLVDGCYSFWQGATFPLIHVTLMKEKGFISDYWLFNQAALQEYILICCQHPSGGLLDKPYKNRDIYHTCYALSGLSVAQISAQNLVLGSPNLNLVKEIHPAYNLVFSCAINALKYFETLPIPD